jgi:hypothetical protein
VNDELNEDGRVTVKEGGKEVQAQWFVLGVHNMEFIVYAQVPEAKLSVGLSWSRK